MRIVRSNEQEPRGEQLTSMRKTIPIQDLGDYAEMISQNCKDYYIKGNKVYMNDDLTISMTSDQGEKLRLPLSTHSFSQLCTKLELPVRYANRCAEKGEIELLKDNFNTWLDRNNSELLIRTHGNKVRGVLSNKYSVLDTNEIIESVGNIVGDTLRVKDYFINEERFHARMIQSEPMNINNEELYAGITLDSSDVGRNNLTANFFVYKQVCTNGLIVAKGNAELFKQKHIGISKDDFKRGFERGIEYLPQIVAETEERIRISANDFLNQDQINNLIQKCIEEVTLSEDAGKKVIDLATVRYGRTTWGVVNALTEVAQKYTLERRIQMESYASKLLKVA